MSSPILITKLFIPTPRQDLVSRPQLTEQLNQGLDRKMTLVSAPAGFGKTTVVSHWLEDLQENQSAKVGWLSLDEDDNDPIRFLTYFASALNKASAPEKSLGNGALNMLQSQQPPDTTDIMVSLINELAECDEQFIFVLDDYHLIEEKPIDQAIGFLLDNLPPQLHLVISTRQDPVLSLSRLRARNELNELRAADLRFSTSEAADFLNSVMGLGLSPQDVAVLESRTEGWIAGLQLAAISLQERKDPSEFIKSFTGGHRLVLDFLIEEVLDRQTEKIHNFLLRTSILNRLNGSLCDAVSGYKDSQQTLEYLEQANLFIIPLDEERRWYRYHHLFADLLRKKLHQKFEGEIEDLHRKASYWFEQEKDIDNAIEHSLKAADFERTANMIERTIDSTWGRGEHRNLARWMKLLPDEVLFARPDISVHFARYQCNMGQFDDAQNTLEIIEQAVRKNHRKAGKNQEEKQDNINLPEKQILGRVAATKGVLASFQGDIRGMIQFSSEALDLLPQNDLTWRNLTAVILGNAHGFRGDMVAAYNARYEAMKACKAAGDIYLNIMASLEVAITLRAMGRLKETLEICQTQILVAQENKLLQTRNVAWLLAVWGETLVEYNDLDGGIQRAREGYLLAEDIGDLPIIGWSLFCLIRVLFSRGEIKEAEEIIQTIEKNSLRLHYPAWVLGQLATWQARIHLLQNKIEEASKWMDSLSLDPEMGIKPIDEIHFFLLSEYVVAARVLIGQSRWDDAVKLLQHLLVAAENGCRTSKTIEILILLSLAYQALDNTDQALSELKKALIIAEPEGFIRIFVDEGPPMATLLYEALNRGITPDYVQRLLAAFPDTKAAPKTQADQSGLIEPLSDREIEVLQLLAKGLTNQIIGDRLYISPHTVKVHTRNIYGKLGVNNRTLAVDKARTLGILPLT